MCGIREKELEDCLAMSNDEGYRQMDRAIKAEKEAHKWFEIATETRKRNDELEKQLQEAFDQVLQQHNTETLILFIVSARIDGKEIAYADAEYYKDINAIGPGILEEARTAVAEALECQRERIVILSMNRVGEFTVAKN